MRAILLSTLALGALTTAAAADEPLTLTDEQMDKVTAGAAGTIDTPGSPGTVFTGEPSVFPFGTDVVIEGQLGEGGNLYVPGAPLLIEPGLPAE
jgi:hypothetical protein